MVCDDYRLRDGGTKVVQPDSGLEMKAHSGLELGLVSGPQADGSFTPVRRKIKSDRVTDPAVLAEPVAVQNLLPDVFNVFGSIPGPHHLKRCITALDDHRRQFRYLLRGSAEVNAAGQWCMVVAVRAGDLHDDQGVVWQGFGGPGQVRGAGSVAHLDERAHAGVVAVLALQRRDLAAVGFGDYLVLGDTGGDGVDRSAHGATADPTRRTHVVQLGIRFDQPSPVHQFAAVIDTAIG